MRAKSEGSVGAVSASGARSGRTPCCITPCSIGHHTPCRISPWRITRSHAGCTHVGTCAPRRAIHIPYKCMAIAMVIESPLGQANHPRQSVSSPSPVSLTSRHVRNSSPPPEDDQWAAQCNCCRPSPSARSSVKPLAVASVASPHASPPPMATLWPHTPPSSTTSSTSSTCLPPHRPLNMARARRS